VPTFCVPCPNRARRGQEALDWQNGRPRLSSRVREPGPRDLSPRRQGRRCLYRGHGPERLSNQVNNSMCFPGLLKAACSYTPPGSPTRWPSRPPIPWPGTAENRHRCRAHHATWTTWRSSLARLPMSLPSLERRSCPAQDLSRGVSSRPADTNQGIARARSVAHGEGEDPDPPKA